MAWCRPRGGGVRPAAAARGGRNRGDQGGVPWPGSAADVGARGERQPGVDAARRDRHGDRLGQATEGERRVAPPAGERVRSLRHRGEGEVAAPAREDAQSDHASRGAAAGKLQPFALQRGAPGIGQTSGDVDGCAAEVEALLPRAHVVAEASQQVRVRARDVVGLEGIVGDRVQLLVPARGHEVAPPGRAHPPAVVLGNPAPEASDEARASDRTSALHRIAQAASLEVADRCRSGVVEQRRRHVQRRDQIVAHDPGVDVARPAQDERRAEAELVQRALARADARTGHARVLAVVGQVDDQRVVTQAACVERRQHAADHRVEPAHVRVVRGLGGREPRARVRARELGRRVVGPVRQHRRDPQEERPPARLVEERLERRHGAAVGPAVATEAVAGAAEPAREEERREPVRESGRGVRALPELAAFPREVAGARQLARDGAVVLHLGARRQRAEHAREDAAPPLPLLGVDAREQRAQGRLAETRRALRVDERGAARGERVEVRRAGTRVAHEARVRPAVIVPDQQDEVRRTIRGSGRRSGGEEQAEPHENEDGEWQAHGDPARMFFVLRQAQS